MFRIALLSIVCGSVAIGMAPSASGKGQAWYEKAVKKVESKFTPAEAKPGQTVTFSLTVELNKGYHTYPTVQSDPGATNLVNDIQFPDAGTIIFVGTVQDPKDTKVKPEPALKISELRYCEDNVTYSRKAVVSPKALPGPTTVKLKSFNLSVCDENNCFPPKKVPVESTLKVIDGPAVPVEKEFVDEVKKALGDK